MPTMGLALEIALFVGIVVADAFGLVPLTQTVALLPLVWIALRIRREPWSSIGFRRPEKLGSAIGVVLGLAQELFSVFVTTPLLSSAFGVEPDYSSVSAVRGNLPVLFIFLALSWTLGAFGEEVCFRGFLMNRLARLMGQSRWAWLASLVLSSVLFGWGHTEQGITGWVQEGLAALFLGAMFLLSGKNLVVPMVAHGTSNTLAFVLIYFGHYPGLE
jgi:uncharacterized protein